MRALTRTDKTKLAIVAVFAKLSFHSVCFHANNREREKSQRETERKRQQQQQQLFLSLVLFTARVRERGRKKETDKPTEAELKIESHDLDKTSLLLLYLLSSPRLDYYTSSPIISSRVVYLEWPKTSLGIGGSSSSSSNVDTYILYYSSDVFLPRCCPAVLFCLFT